MATQDPDKRIERLLIEWKESVECRIRALQTELSHTIRAGFDATNADARRDHTGILLQDRWVTRMNAYAERMDKSIEHHDIKNAEFQKRRPT